jgi:3-carboxy-cis,cis-muconate cycloisomerase
MGAKGTQVRSALARRLDLRDPGAPWHTERDGLAQLAGWMASLCGSLAKMGEDLILLTQTGVGEVRLASAGGSSTMPQKQNPVGPSVLVALGRQAAALSGLMQSAVTHRQQRDGAAWFTEWLALPPLCIGTGRALSLARETVSAIAPDAARMAAALDADGGLIHAEALSFALAGDLGREAAEATVKRLCAEALASGRDVRDLAQRDFPSSDWRSILAAATQWGDATDQALAFARQASPGALST